MQTFEALVSLFTLVLMAAMLVSGEEMKLDTSLHVQHVANDAWRVLYLRGDFRDVHTDLGGLELPAAAKEDLDKIGEMTGYCIYFAGVRGTNCPGIETRQILTLEKTIIADGVPAKAAFTIAIKE
jgi:hypothetical protein